MNIINDEVVEVWSGIEGFPSYQVSNLGRVRSLDKWANHRRGAQFIKGKILKPELTKRGYYAVTLYSIGKNVRSHCCIHVLVAKSFVLNTSNKPFVNHNDGCKTNNISSNLEWATNSENVQHAFDTKLTIALKGSQCHISKLKEDQIITIRERIKNKEPHALIAKDYGVSKSLISHIKRGKAWNHV